MLKMTYILIFLLLLGINSCKRENKITRHTVEYTEPYFAVTLDHTLIYPEPGETSKIVTQLKIYRIVKMRASVSLINPSPVWYYIEESDFKGYALGKYFKLFDTLQEAETFQINRLPDRGLISRLMPYRLSKQDFIKGDYSNSIIRLYRFLGLSENLKKNHPIIYNSTMILIGQIYLRQNETQKALLHFNELLRGISGKEISLLGSQFNPKEVQFHIDEIVHYLKHKPFKKRSTLMKWEALFYLGLVYEMKNETHRAKRIYLKILSKKKNLDIPSHFKITYINLAIDHIVNLTRKRKRVSILKSIRKKVDWKGSARYILFKLGYLIELEISNSSKKKSSARVKSAIHYYKQFITLSEKMYQVSPYPGEISHRFTAQERINKLRNQK